MSNPYDNDDYFNVRDNYFDDKSNYDINILDDIGIDDFDNLRDNLFEELEEAISYAHSKLQLAIGCGCGPAEIARLEDELTLLMMDYEKFEV